MILLGAAEALDERWKPFVAVALIVGLGVLSLTATFARLQRHRAFSLISSAGGVAIPIGVLLGPIGVGLVNDTVLSSARPLAMIGLGWIGLIVGLQLKRELLAIVPGFLWRWTIADALVCGACAALVATTLMFAGARMVPPWTGSAFAGVLPIAAFAMTTIGWSPETRSLQLRTSVGASRVRVLVQAGSGLASLMAVAGIGVVADFLSRDEPSFAQSAVDLVVAAVAAVGIAIGCRLLLARVQRDQPETTLVLLGALALLSGVADELRISPVFAGLLCGAVLTNLGGPATRDLKDGVRRAEPALAAFFFVVAGTLINGADAILAIELAMTALLIRIFVKPIIAAYLLRSEAPALERELPVRSLPLRQAPIATVLLVSLVLVNDSPALRSVLAGAALSGLLAALVMFLFARPGRTTGHAAEALA